MGTKPTVEDGPNALARPLEDGAKDKEKEATADPAPTSAPLKQTYSQRRKSLAAANAANAAPQPVRKPLSRMSLSSAPSDAWTRFNKDTPLPAIRETASTGDKGFAESELTEEGLQAAGEAARPRPSVVSIMELDAERRPMGTRLSTISDKYDEEEEQMEMDEVAPQSKMEQRRQTIPEDEEYEEEEDLVSQGFFFIIGFS